MHLSISISYLAIMVSILNTIQVATLFIQYKMNPNRRGIGLWGLANTITAIGFVFNYLRIFPQIQSISILLSVSSFILGMILFLIGTMKFFDHDIHYGKLFAVYFGMIAFIVYFTFINDSFLIRRTGATFFISLISLVIAYLFGTTRQKSVIFTSRLVSIVFVLYAITYMSSNIPFFVEIHLGEVTTTELLQLFTYGTNIVFSTLWTFGFVLLINQRLNEEILNSLSNQEIIFETSPDAVLITRLSDGTFVGVNEGFCNLTGYDKHEVLRKTTLDLDIWMTPEDRSEFVGILQNKKIIENKEYRFKMKDGTIIIGLISARIIQYKGEPHIISVTHDITNRKFADEKFRMLFELSPIGFSMVDNNTGIFLEVNESLLEMTGYTKEEFLKLSYWDITPPEYIELERKQMNDILETGFFGPNEKEYIRKDGSRFNISISGVLVKGANGEIINWGFVEDITERKKLQAELKKQATTDELTGLYNRRHFMYLAQKEFKRSIRNFHPLTVALFDLDRLKFFNDNFGHNFGDKALITFANQCKANLRDIDIFARHGGDEFALLLPETSIEVAEVVLERVRKIINQSTIQIDEKEFNLSASIGIATMEHRNDTLDEVLARADAALYMAKDRGKNCVVIKHDPNSHWPVEQ